MPGSTSSTPTRARRLILGESGIEGVWVSDEHGERTLESSAVVLACGGFEANAAWRAKHLGSVWQQAKVRGTRFKHRRWHPDGARRRGLLRRPLAGLSRGCLGPARPPTSAISLCATSTRSTAIRSASSSTPTGNGLWTKAPTFETTTYAKYGRRRARAA